MNVVTGCLHVVERLVPLVELHYAEAREAWGQGRATSVEKKGARFLGAGANKSTYSICEKHVLKIEHKVDGVGFNQLEREWAFWLNATAEIRPYLAIAYASDGKSWMVQERIHEVGKQGKDHAKMEALLTAAGMNDLHPANYGRRKDGSAVVFDYGYIRENRLDRIKKEAEQQGMEVHLANQRKRIRGGRFIGCNEGCACLELKR